jgi:mono/diheme cytochrome c family protein
MIRGARWGLLLFAGLWYAPLVLTAQERLTRPGADEADAADHNEDGQPTKLPALPPGLTLDMIRQGDDLFRGKAACNTCHGPDGGGMPASGSGITAGLNFVPAELSAIDSLIKVGIPEPTTRTPVAMPPRGATSNLTDEETRKVAAYVWAISQVRGEPWPGGHRSHRGSGAADTAAARQNR